MHMENTENLSLAERAYRCLRNEILYGDLMPGDRLRASELQDRFNLGLTPIREALMRLSSENLVEVDPNRGSRVSDASITELTDLMATRREMEKLCLTSAMTHGDTAWEGEIVAALHRLSRTPLPSSKNDRDAATQWELQHRSFHLALVSACKEKWLLKFWNTLTDHSERYRKYRLLQHIEQPAQAQVRNVSEEHQALMDAVLRRDIASATNLMQEHLNATEKSVARLLRQIPSSTKAAS